MRRNQTGVLSVQKRRQIKPLRNIYADPLQRLMILARADLRRSTKLAKSYLVSTVPELSELGCHAIAINDRKFYSALAVTAGRLCGQAVPAAVPAYMDVVHTLSLVHDDIIDQSNLRYGKASVQALWGTKMGVFGGDFMLGRAFLAMSDDGASAIAQILAKALADIAEGEMLQRQTDHCLNTSIDNYFDVIGHKTAPLFRAACEIGAISAYHSNTERKAVAEFGFQFGLIYQIIDDILDFIARPALLGKAAGDDFYGGVMTLPVILAYARSKGAERRFWRHAFHSATPTTVEFQQARTYLLTGGALRDTLDIADRYRVRAQRALLAFDASAERLVLRHLVDWCWARGGRALRLAASSDSVGPDGF